MGPLEGSGRRRWAGRCKASRHTPPCTVPIQCHPHLQTLACAAPCHVSKSIKQRLQALQAAKIPHLQAQLWQALLKSLEARDAPVMDAVAHVFEALLGECCPQSWSLLPVGSGTLDSNRWPDTLRPTRHCSFYGVCRPKNAGTPPSLIELNAAGRRSCTVRFLVPQR